MKTVQRTFSGVLLYRTIRSGFYPGCKDEIIYYPFPSMKELENRNYEFLSHNMLSKSCFNSYVQGFYPCESCFYPPG